MRINLYFVITLGLIGHILSVDAQNTGSRSEGYKAFGTITRQLNSNNTLDLSKVKGSPYANEAFLPGQLFFKEKNIKSIFYIKIGIKRPKNPIFAEFSNLT